MNPTKLIPIAQLVDDNQQFVSNPLCQESIYATIDFYKRVGFAPPWIGYYAEQGGLLVGCAAFKGAPINGTVEIAYGTFEEFQKQGVATLICKKLVELAQQTDKTIRISARTLPEKNYSTRVLEKNEFVLLGMVEDPEDGNVWEWEFKGK